MSKKKKEPFFKGQAKSSGLQVVENAHFPQGNEVTWGEIKALRDVPSRFDEVCQASGWPILINVEFGLSALLVLREKPWQWVFPFKHEFQLYAPLSAISHAVHHFHKPILMTAPWVNLGVFGHCVTNFIQSYEDCTKIDTLIAEAGVGWIRSFCNFPVKWSFLYYKAIE